MPSTFVPRFFMPARYTALAGLGCLLLATGLARGQCCAAEPTVEPEPEVRAEVRVEVVEIPRTTLSIALVPVEIGEGKTLLVAQREISWPLYDTFVFSLEQDDPYNPDDGAIVTRPTKPYINMDQGWGHSDFPAMGMSQLAATEFCIWLSHTTGQRFRLPTEAEWEAIALQSGTTPENIDARSWHAGNAGEVTRKRATKEADDLGLYDLLGNVGEWCFTEQGKPIVRGGSYLDEAETLSPKSRLKPDRSWNATDPQIPKSKWWLADCTWVGFRPVIEVAAEPAEEDGDTEDAPALR